MLSGLSQDGFGKSGFIIKELGTQAFMKASSISLMLGCFMLN